MNKHTVRWVPDEARWVPTSGGFKVDDDGLSTFAHRLLTEVGRGPADVGAHEKPATVFTLSVGAVVDAGARARPDPQPIPETIGHAHVLVTFPDSSQQRRVLNRLCLCSGAIWGVESLPAPPT